MIRLGKIITGKWNNTEYKVLYKLGQGGIGSVYKVRDSEGNFRALKLSKDITSITREYNVLKELDQIGCVPKVYDIDDYEEYGEVYYFFIMDFVSGCNLKELIERTDVSEKKIIGIGIILLNILEKIYKMGYMYSDIKLENIMLDKNGSDIIFIDFGGAVESQYGVREYTPTYNMHSWGICLDKKYPQSLIFSVTMIIISMLTGREFNPVIHDIRHVVSALYMHNIHTKIKKIVQQALNGGYNSIDEYIVQLKISLRLCNNGAPLSYKHKKSSKHNVLVDVVFASGIILFLAAIITGVYLI